MEVNTRAPGDVVLLAADDVYSAVGEPLLAQSRRAQRDDPKACVRELLDNASANGGGGSAYVIPDEAFEVEHPTVSIGAATFGSAIEAKAAYE